MLKVAFRNLARHWRRTLLVGCLFAFAALSLVVNASVMNGISQLIDASVQRHLTGNVVIKSADNRAVLGKLNTGKIAAIDNWQEVERQIAGRSDVTGMLKRIGYSAMLVRDQKQTFATVYGMEQKGGTVIPYAISDGEPLGAARGGLLLSPHQAATLGARVGDSVTVMATDRSGMSQALPLKVKGILRTTEFALFRQAEVHLSYQDAQALFGLAGAPTEYLLATADSRTVARELGTALSGRAVRVEPWDVAGQEFLKSKDQLRVSMMGMFALFGVVIAAILFNMVQMQVQERIREIGTMSSLGMTWTQILGLLLLETFVLGAVASLIGGGATYAAVRVIARSGIAWGDGAASVFGGTVLVPQISLATVALFGGILTLLGLLGALFPAIKGARIAPADSLRTV